MTYVTCFFMWNTTGTQYYDLCNTLLHVKCDSKTIWFMQHIILCEMWQEHNIMTYVTRYFIWNVIGTQYHDLVTCYLMWKCSGTQHYDLCNMFLYVKRYWNTFLLYTLTRTGKYVYHGVYDIAANGRQSDLSKHAIHIRMLS